ncbi:STAS domain-containing protein [Kineococcus sp. SYSU DK005]|uniref:STAS domain-containing protein n=1 Tax=Kineococcus sp. SYSU DK005 TaxID=3383126 RepID=UPI003D7DE14B
MALNTLARFPADPAEPVVLWCRVGMDTTDSVIFLGGELDADSAALLQAVIGAQIETGHLQVHLQISELRFCDVRGVAALVQAQRRLRAAGGDLHVRGAGAFVERVLGWCGAGELLAEPSGDLAGGPGAGPAGGLAGGARR